MYKFNVYIYIIINLIIIPLSVSFRRNFYLHQLAQAAEALADYNPIDSQDCTKHTDCLNSQVCDGKICIEPCIGQCGIDSICNVLNHTLSCRCIECYHGDPYVKCTPYLSIDYWICQLFGI